MVDNLKTVRLLPVYCLGFLFAFHVATITYINSSFLSRFVLEQWVGSIYTLGSILAIFYFFLIPMLLQKVGNYRLALSLVALEMISLVGLIFSQTAEAITIFFLVSFVSISLTYFSFDIFLEGFSKNFQTGRIRGTYLTCFNFAYIFAPIIAGYILTNGDYWKIYTTSLLLLIPAALILLFGLKNFKDSEYIVLPVWRTIKSIARNKNLRNIFGANFLLHFFYSLMVIYTPIYLYKHVGFSWQEIGLIFSIMLVPFVLTQFPLGRLADKRLGETEILSVGFIIMAITTAALSFLSPQASLWVWAALLFVTRVGASSVEIMCDTYFFKKVDGPSSEIISFFRISNPLAYVLGPLFVTALLSFFDLDLRYLFLVLGIIMLLGLKFSLALKDTK